jgi:hypothetical protein
MDDFMRSIGAAFVAAFALQQLIELLDPILDSVVRRQKKWVLSAISLLAGLGLTFGLGLRIIGPLGMDAPDWADAIVTALFITGGTKGINDLLKLIGYQKEAARAQLAATEADRV